MSRFFLQRTILQIQNQNLKMGALSLTITTLTAASAIFHIYLGVYHCDTIENSIFSFLAACCSVLFVLALDAQDHSETWERIKTAMGMPLYIGCLLYEFLFIFGTHYALSYLVNDWNAEMKSFDLALTLGAVYVMNEFIAFTPMHKTLLHEKGIAQHWIHHLPKEASPLAFYLFHPLDLTLEFIPGYSMVLAGLLLSQSKMIYHISFLVLWVLYNMEHDSTLKLQHWEHHRVCFDYFHAYTKVTQRLPKDLALVEVQKRMSKKD